MSPRKKLVTAEEIEKAALELPREELLPPEQRLLETAADGPEFRTPWYGVPPERRRLWREEAERRAAAVRDGSLGLVDAEEVLFDPDEDE